MMAEHGDCSFSSPLLPAQAVPLFSSVSRRSMPETAQTHYQGGEFGLRLFI